MDTKATIPTIFRTVGAHTHCKVYARPLSDHVSMQVGMGPVCRANAGPPIEDLFNSRSDFEVEVEGKIVTVIDLNLGGRSVTTDAEGVVMDLCRRGILQPGMRLIYRDSTGRWDEMLWIHNQFSAFAPITNRLVTDRDEALALTRERYRHLLG